MLSSLAATTAAGLVRAAPAAGARTMATKSQNFGAYTCRDTQNRSLLQVSPRQSSADLVLIRAETAPALSQPPRPPVLCSQMTIEAPVFEPTPFSKDDGDGPSAIKVSRPGFVMLRMFPIVDSETGARPDWTSRRTARLYADSIGRIAVTPADQTCELSWRMRAQPTSDEAEPVIGRLELSPSRSGDGSADLMIDDGTGEALHANIAAHQLFVMRHVMFSSLPHITGLGSIHDVPAVGGPAGFAMG